MEEQNYKEGILNAIKVLDKEVQHLRLQRDNTLQDKSKESLSNQMLSHILSIQHLREIISDDEE